MLLFSIGLFLAASFGSGSSSNKPTQPLQGPAPPQQTIHQQTPSQGKTPTQQQPPINRELLQQKMREREAQSYAEGPLYIYPGVVRVKDGRWVGFDYLYNVGSNIPIEVTIVKPPEASVPISEEAIKNRMAEEFQNAGIDTSVLTAGGQPPRALFNMMILIYPLNEGFIALCDGRLLETVGVKRVELASTEGVFQAITWEHKKLIVAPTENFASLLTQTVESITRAFLERHKFFESFKKRQEGGLTQ